MRKKRTLVLACAALLLCMSLIVGGTYALLSDSSSNKNHLIAGNLDLKLTRDKLTYTVLTEDGFLEEKHVDLDKDFSGENTDNVFGLEDGKTILMVPGSFYEAEMILEHAKDSNVAFDYIVRIDLDEKLMDDENDKAFMKRLMVSVYEADEDGKYDEDHPSIQTPLDQLHAQGTADSTSAKTMSVTSGATKFKVRVAFMNDETNQMDNAAKKGEVYFDMVVEAVQRTDKPTGAETTDSTETTATP